MAIPSEGQFTYEVVLTRARSGAWGGLAAASAIGFLRPGLAGNRPEVELAGGVVTLRRTESGSGWLKFNHRARGSPSQVSFRVGEALEAVVSDGDRLQVSRGPTTDLAVTLFRRKDLLMGLGAIDHQLGKSLTIQEDPRAFEVRLNHLAATLDKADTTLVWLDCDDSDLEGTIGTLRHLPGDRLIIAIAGRNPEERRRLNLRIGRNVLGSTHSSCEYFDVPSQFTTREQWLGYVRQLPKTRPLDLYIRFDFGDTHIDVREGEQVFNKPWHLFVAKVFTFGVPGEWSQLGVALEHPALTASMVADSTRLIASRHIDMRS